MISRLEKAYKNGERLLIDGNSKIVCMSDCHRGIGNRGDNFLPNQNLFLAALDYYFIRNFCYVELGDGDELWENRSFERIREIHEDAFNKMARYCCRGGFYMLYGNHDCCKQKREQCTCWRVVESLVLKECNTGHEIMLLHGHQGDWLNDRLWPLARFLVRYVWKPLELLGVPDPTSAARNNKLRRKTERRLEKFAGKKQILVIAGHTHRPMLSVPGESFYLNSGSCVHPRCITAIELEKGNVTLVKWSVVVRCDRVLSIERKILEGPIPWERYWNESL